MSRAVVDVLTVVLRPRHHHAPQISIVQVQLVTELQVDHRLHETQTPHRLLLDSAIEADAPVRIVSSCNEWAVRTCCSEAGSRCETDPRTVARSEVMSDPRGYQTPFADWTTSIPPPASSLRSKTKTGQTAK